MKTCDVGQLSEFAVLSDVHLSTPDDALTQSFIRTLNSLQKTEAVFLLGDIFDFIFADSRHFLTKWSNVFDALRALKQSGTKLFFCEGNHDFGFAHFRSAFLDSVFTAYGDVIFTATHAQLGLIHLRHGDDVICPPSYEPFRRFVKSRSFQKVASLVPGQAMDWICSRWALHSRRQERYKELQMEFVRSCTDHYVSLFEPKPKIVVLGHIHVDVDEVRNGYRLLVGRDWLTSPNYLRFSGSSFQRIAIE